MKITPADVGRKVVLRNGDIVTIQEYLKDSGIPWLVKANGEFYTPEGYNSCWLIKMPTDIIAFADEPEATYKHETQKLASLPTKTLRDEFAMAVMQSLYLSIPKATALNQQSAAKASYQMADAMMAEREGK